MEDLICRLKVHGFQRKEIAYRLHRSENTLITHNKHIHSKLQVNNDVETVVWYIENILKIEIKKFIQVAVLLALLLPSILLDGFTGIRTMRTPNARTARVSRRAECENDYILEL